MFELPTLEKARQTLPKKINKSSSSVLPRFGGLIRTGIRPQLVGKGRWIAFELTKANSLRHLHQSKYVKYNQLLISKEKPPIE
jgi:hypothetical protein